MKNKIALLLSLAFAVTAVYADKDKDKDKEKDLPPGLRKKDKLPPGIAKRQGVQGTSITTNVIVTNVMVTNITVTNFPGRAATVPSAPTVRQGKIDLDPRVRSINTLDNRDAVRRAGMAAIARETGVPLTTLQKQRAANENIGTGGLLIANTIAARTKKPAANYFSQHVAGKSWERIATENQVSLEELDAKLGRVEEAMRKAK
jgi:hypothetical protein